MEYKKEFDEWNEIKKKLDLRDREQFFHEKEIWWCSLGINIGSEEDGKGRLYLRPVLIYKKINKSTFVGIPITSKVRISYQYLPFYFNYDFRSMIISQIRILDNKRLVGKIGRITDYLHQKAKKAVINFLN